MACLAALRASGAAGTVSVITNLRDMCVQLTVRTHLLSQLYRFVKGGRFGIRHIVDDTYSTLWLSPMVPGRTEAHPPSWCASAAVRTRAVNMRSFAFASPKRRVRRCVPPAPGIIPSLTSGRPIFVTAWPVRSSPCHQRDAPGALGRPPTRHPQVARQPEFEPAAERRPVDRGNGGHRQALERAKCAAEVDEELVHLRLGHARALDEVCARAERPERRGAYDQYACAVGKHTQVFIRHYVDIMRTGARGTWTYLLSNWSLSRHSWNSCTAQYELAGDNWGRIWIERTFSRFIDIAFFALGLFSSKEVIPGWLGSGSRYASATPALAGGCPVCMNLRAAHRVRALLSTVKPDTRALAAIMTGMGDASRSVSLSHPRIRASTYFPTSGPPA